MALRTPNRPGVIDRNSGETVAAQPVSPVCLCIATPPKYVKGASHDAPPEPQYRALLMARMRSLKPEFWADRKIARLSRDARLLYLALWNQADEWGRCRGDARLIKGECFPYDDDLDPAAVQGLLDEIAGLGRIVPYEADDEVYLFLPKLAKHQRLEPAKTPSRHPAPPQIGPEPSVESTDQPEPVPDPFPQVPDLPAPVPDQSGKIPDSSALIVAKHVACGMEHVACGMEQVAGNTSREAPRKPDRVMNNQPAMMPSAEVPRGRSYSAAFLEFCGIYPNGNEDQPRAWDEWGRAVRRVASPQVILTGARRYADDPNRTYTKAPWNWLANDAWNNPPCRAPVDREGRANGRPHSRSIVPATATTRRLEVG